MLNKSWLVLRRRRISGRRFTIEETFRDQKDLRFGMGLRETRMRAVTAS